MPANSVGFVFAMIGVAEIFTMYDNDHADVYLCGGCRREARWKDRRQTPMCFRCGSSDLTLIRKRSEY